jgi:ketosteroid isomerase-like protein
MLDHKEFDAWLASYKSAWENRDDKQIAKIFSDDANYQSSPYSPPMKGVDQIRDYWNKLGPDQNDIQFEYKIWQVADDVGVAHWRCRYTQKSTFERVDLDGIFRCVFSTKSGKPGRCTELLAWWHSRNTSLGEI